MRKNKLPFLLLLFFPLFVFGEEREPHVFFLIPQTIFVGDSGRLVLQLGEDYFDAEPFVRDSFDLIPTGHNLHITRVELEQRGLIPRLLIDFIPYAPGLLTFPPLELSPDLIIDDLEVNIASILNPSRMNLAAAASPLAQPGTGFLLYGSIGLLLLLLFLGIGGSILGRRHFSEIWEKFRRRYLLRNMISFLRRLKYECENKINQDSAYYLGLLSGEFREFLSVYTGYNCRSLSAGEFLELNLFDYNQFQQEDEESEIINWEYSLFVIFRSLDTFRFSGTEIEPDDLLKIISDAGNFTFALDMAEKERPIISALDIGNLGANI